MKKLPFLIQLATALTKNKKQVVYIAGKVTGLPQKEVQRKFADAKYYLEKQGYLVLNPVDYIGPEYNSEEMWPKAMRVASTLLNMADVIYMLPCWTDSKGARWEWDTARLFGLDVIFADGTRH